MLEKKQLKKAEKIIKEFFKKATLEADFKLEDKPEGLKMVLNVPEPQVLIGERGRALAELQTILGKILRRQLETPVFLDLDINQYKESKIRYLKEVAASLADNVALQKSEKALFPMTSYERRIVHLELAKRNDVKTESIGQEGERRVVIRPA